jgi:hypothetical protein
MAVWVASIIRKSSYLFAVSSSIVGWSWSLIRDLALFTPLISVTFFNTYQVCMHIVFFVMLYLFSDCFAVALLTTKIKHLSSVLNKKVKLELKQSSISYILLSWSVDASCSLNSHSHSILLGLRDKCLLWLWLSKLWQRESWQKLLYQHL